MYRRGLRLEVMCTRNENCVADKYSASSHPHNNLIDLTPIQP